LRRGPSSPDHRSGRGLRRSGAEIHGQDNGLPDTQHDQGQQVFEGGAVPPVADPNGVVYVRYGRADGTPGTGDMSAPSSGVASRGLQRRNQAPDRESHHGPVVAFVALLSRPLGL
jgi:hypothetical protein